jgi:hypothetical protein
LSTRSAKFEEKLNVPSKVKGHIRHPSEDFLKDFSFTRTQQKIQEEAILVIPSIVRDLSPSKKRTDIMADVPASLTDLNLSTFIPKTNTPPPPDPKTKAREAFEEGRGALLERTISSTDDPFGSLDPLWTLKK